MPKGSLPVVTIAVICVIATNAVALGAPDDSNALVPGDAGFAYVFITGNELGSLRPCGCSVHQLGGFDKRSNVWKNVTPESRLIVDTGTLLETTGEQDLIKFDIMVQAFSLLGYDLVCFTRADYDVALPRGYLTGATFKVVAPASVSGGQVPSVFTKELPLASGTIAIHMATIDPGLAVSETDNLLPRHAPGEALNILLYNRMFDKIDLSSLATPVDVLVCLSGSDAPEILDKTRTHPLVISVGRTGKYVGKLTIHPSDGGPTLGYEAIPVGEELPSVPALVDLYKNYQQIVKEENLLAKYPRRPLPNSLEYVGSKSCKVCHEEQYGKWRTLKHAQAWKSLVEVGSDFDPECVGCHVVGLKYEGGFVSAKQTPELENVGCEDCHGPNSKHIESLGKTKTEEPKYQCTDCHTPDNSPNYAGHEQEYRSKIVHWKEQNDANSVKK
jgi:hypothetical protein